MLRVLVALAFCLVASSSFAAGRVALVIGNGAYQNATPLNNPVNDAAAVSKALEAIGFTVVVGTDLDKAGMERTLREYASALRTADMALFYYSGHGLQVNGINYLVPVDAQLADETSLAFEMIDADLIFNLMGGNDRLALAFLDACRDNPLARSLKRSMGKTRSAAVGNGLAAPNTVGTGLFISFSTSPNDVALDGDGEFSPFTAAVLEHIATPGLEINQVMTRVKASVRTATNDDQRPWTNSDLSTDVYLVPLATPATPEPAPTVAVLPDEQHWQIIETSEVPAVFEEFLKRYPNSARREDAEARLAELTPDAVTPEPEAEVVQPLAADCDDSGRYRSLVVGLSLCVDLSVWQPSPAIGQQEYVFIHNDGNKWIYVIPEAGVYTSAKYRSGILDFFTKAGGLQLNDIDVKSERAETLAGRRWDVMAFSAPVSGLTVDVLNYRTSRPGFGSVQIVFVSAVGMGDEVMAEVDRVIGSVGYDGAKGTPQVFATPDEIHWTNLRGSSDVAALQNFMTLFPQSARRNEAQQLIASLEGDVPTPRAGECDPGDTLHSRVIDLDFCVESGKWIAQPTSGTQEFSYLSNDNTMLFAAIPQTDTCPAGSCRDVIFQYINSVMPDHELRDERVETINGRDWNVIEFRANYGGNDLTYLYYWLSEPGIGSLQMNFASLTPQFSNNVQVIHDFMSGVTVQ